MLKNPTRVLENSTVLERREHRRHLTDADHLHAEADALAFATEVHHKRRAGFNILAGHLEAPFRRADEPSLISIAHRPWPGMSSNRTRPIPANGSSSRAAGELRAFNRPPGHGPAWSRTSAGCLPGSEERGLERST